MPAVSQVSTGPVGGLGEDAGEACGGGRRTVGEEGSLASSTKTKYGDVSRRWEDAFLGRWSAARWPEARAGEDGHGGGVGGYGGGVDPRDALLDGEVVDEVAGFEVVGGVEDEVGGAEEIVDVGGDEVGDVGGDLDGGVGGEELAAGGFGFGEGVGGVLFVEEDLALEVGGLDEVAVDEGEVADAGAGEERGGGGAGGADADDGDVGAGEGRLAGLADAGEEDLAGVALGRVGGRWRNDGGRRVREGSGSWSELRGWIEGGMTDRRVRQVVIGG